MTGVVLAGGRDLGATPEADQGNGEIPERSCQDLWTFLPEGSGGSGHGVTSVEVEAEEVG
jgi:hypothetical protein